jgi:5-methylcytosine-specific restriction endonuclease McrBC regulatory subunit McrC
MPTNQVTLITHRQILRRRLATVERQITRNEEARARLKGRIQFLEQRKQRAA